MKKALATAFTLVFACALIGPNIFCVMAASSDMWVTKAPLLYPTGIAYEGATVLDGKIYAIGSSSDNLECMQVYDPTLNSWVEKAQTLNYTGIHAIATYNNKIYDVLASQAYDPVSDSWSPIARMPNWLTGVQANEVDGKIYVIGGIQGIYPPYFSATSFNRVYDPTNDSWSEMKPIPVAVAYYGSAVLDNRIYIIGGVNSNSSFLGARLNLVQIFDPLTDSWTQGKSMPVNISSIAAVATSGLMAPQRLYTFGGYGVDDRFVDSTLVYDAQTANWSFGTPLPTARVGLSCVNLNDKLFILGGADSSRQGGNWLTEVLEYTPADYGDKPSPSPPIPEISSIAVIAIILVSSVTIILTLLKRKNTFTLID